MRRYGWRAACAAVALAAAIAVVSPARAGSTPDASFDVALRGHQDEIDRCVGFVLEDFGDFGTAIAAHDTCGGAAVLALDVGDLVVLEGIITGRRTVTEIKSVSKDATAAALDGGVWLQTCDGGGSLRLVRIR